MSAVFLPPLSFLKRPNLLLCRVKHQQSPTVMETQTCEGRHWRRWKREGIWVKDWFCLYVQAGLAARKVPTGRAVGEVTGRGARSVELPSHGETWELSIYSTGPL